MERTEDNMEAALQIISKVISSGDYSIIENNLLNEEFFVEYEDEFNYIRKHFKKYGNVPDKFTFMSKFPELELVEVTESDKYLLETVKEERLYYKSIPVVKQIAKLLKTDANDAVKYMIQSMKDLQPDYQLGGTDIIKQAQERYESYVERRNNDKDWTFTTGFEELDALIHGIARMEELIVIFARINNGKSFVAEKIATHIWQIGFNVGYISPEMSANSIGYRFDTLYQGFSNKSLMWADKSLKQEDYKDYIDELQKSDHKFVVATPADFDKCITVTKLKEWIKQFELDFIVIDGINYLTDERFRRGDNKTTSLTNISEDLMALSIELKVPPLVVSQANRMGTVTDEEEDTPELENIKDSDGIAANASKVISLKHTKDGILRMGIKKNRFGPVGGKLNYQWNPDSGEFTFIPSYEDAQPKEKTERKVRKLKKKIKDKEDVF